MCKIIGMFIRVIASIGSCINIGLLIYEYVIIGSNIVTIFHDTQYIEYPYKDDKSVWLVVREN